MSDRDGKSNHRPQMSGSAPQWKVRTNLRGGASAEYPDMSGVCNPASTVPPTSGATYPDMSGVCNPASSVPPTSGASYPDMSGVCA